MEREETREEAQKVRADRSRNRIDILNAAEAVFAEHGFDAPMATLAEQAGVSRMTLSRHFPDRESLAFALFERNVAELQAYAAEWAKRSNGFVLLLDRLTEFYAENVGLAQALTGKAADMEKLDELRRRVVGVAAPLLHAARAAGAIREDLGEEDLCLMMDMFAGAVGHVPPAKRLTRVRRALQLLLGGLRG